VVSSFVVIEEELLSGEGNGKESNGSEKVTPVWDVPCRRMIVELRLLVQPQDILTTFLSEIICAPCKGKRGV